MADVKFAAGGSVVSLDAGGYRAASMDSSETQSAASSNFNTPRATADAPMVSGLVSLGFSVLCDSDCRKFWFQYVT
jgi:hypothetical protein